jgi:hypothetical protein
MGPFDKLTDQEINRLIAGKAPSGTGDLEELATFVGDVKDAFQEAPSAATAAAHLAAITDAARLADQDERGPATPHLGRNPNVRNPFGRLRARLAIIGAAALMLGAFGGVAHAGALPGPVQGTISDLAGNLGIDVPGADDGNVADENANGTAERGDGPADTTDTRDTTNDTTGGRPANADDGQNTDADDGQKDNADDGEVADDNGDNSNVDDGENDNADDRDVANDDGEKDNSDDGEKDDSDDAAQDDRTGHRGGADERDSGDSSGNGDD